MTEDHYTPRERRRDYAIVAAAIRELSNAWVHERVPDAAHGLTLPSEANIALARLAVAADVPWEPIRERVVDDMRENPLDYDDTLRLQTTVMPDDTPLVRRMKRIMGKRVAPPDDAG